MISLKKHIDEYDRELSRALISAYGSALASTVRSCGRAVPPLSAGLHETWKHLKQRLSSTLTPDDIGAIQEEFDSELIKWEDEAAQLSNDNVANVRAIMMAVAASASAIAKRDHRYTDRFNKFTEELNSVARIEDLVAMRRSVLKSASEIRACVEEMKRDWQSSLAELQTQVAEYRANISEYQHRDSIDPLTGLANRTAIEVRIQDRIEWSSNFCLAILDLNGFKEVNDCYGQSAGDDLLKQFARELRLMVRGTTLWAGGAEMSLPL